MFPMADRQEDTQLNGVRAAFQGKWKNKEMCRICLGRLISFNSQYFVALTRQLLFAKYFVFHETGR